MTALIEKLNALASRLTAQGEYEAVDLIDTVVARVTAMQTERELLREALKEIQNICGWCEGPAAILATQTERRMCITIHKAASNARAAADKIRATLTEQNT